MSIINKNRKHPAAAAAHRQYMPGHKTCIVSVFMKWLAPALPVIMAVQASGQISTAGSTFCRLSYQFHIRLIHTTCRLPSGG